MLRCTHNWMSQFQCLSVANHACFCDFHTNMEYPGAGIPNSFTPVGFMVFVFIGPFAVCPWCGHGSPREKMTLHLLSPSFVDKRKVNEHLHRLLEGKDKERWLLMFSTDCRRTDKTITVSVYFQRVCSVRFVTQQVVVPLKNSLWWRAAVFSTRTLCRSYCHSCRSRSRLSMRFWRRWEWES